MDPKLEPNQPLTPRLTGLRAGSPQILGSRPCAAFCAAVAFAGQPFRHSEPQFPNPENALQTS